MAFIGNSLAQGLISGANIQDGTVDTPDLTASAVTTAKVADTNITTGKLADSAVTTAKIADTNITTGKLADSAITTAKIADNAVTTIKLNSSGIAPTITGGTIAGATITSSPISGSTGAFTSGTFSSTLGVTGVATFSANVTVDTTASRFKKAVASATTYSATTGARDEVQLLNSTTGTNTFTALQMGNTANMVLNLLSVQNASGYGDFVLQQYGGAFLETLRVSSAGAVTIPGTLGVNGMVTQTYNANSGVAAFKAVQQSTGTSAYTYYNLVGNTTENAYMVLFPTTATAAGSSPGVNQSDNFSIQTDRAHMSLAAGDVRLYASNGGTLALTAAAAGVTIPGTLGVTGAISGTGADNTIILSQNGSTQWRITNSNAGTGASSTFSLTNGTASAAVYLFGTGYTTNGVLVANRVALYNNSTSGIGLVADNASGTINFAAGGLTSVGSWSSTGLTVTGTLGVGAAPVSEKMRVQTSAGFNFVLDTTSSSMRISAVNDADSLNVAMIIQASTVNVGNGNAVTIPGTLGVTGATSVTTLAASGAVSFSGITGAASSSIYNSGNEFVIRAGTTNKIRFAKTDNSGDMAEINVTGLSITGTLGVSSDVYIETGKKLFFRGAGSGQYIYESAVLQLDLFVDGSIKQRWTTAGTAVTGTLGVTTGIGCGAATPQTGGLAFPATQIAVADANTLDDYEEYTSASTACTGALLVSVVWRVVKIGKQITLHSNSVYGTGQSTTNFTLGLTLPAAYYPVAGTRLPIVNVIVNNASQANVGVLIVSSTTGIMTVYRDATLATSWGAAANTGIEGAFSVSWLTA